MKLRAFLTVVVIGLSAAVVPAAHALTVSSQSVTAWSFEGSACGSTAVALVQLPAGARDARIERPLVGEVLDSDEEPPSPVATITAADVASSEGRLVAGWQATGSNNVCSSPATYPEGWATDEVDLVVRYTQDVRTYVGLAARRRPATLNLGAVGVLRRLAWRSWDGRVARGVGVGPGGAPVRVRLSAPEDCGVYKYLTARYTYARAVPRGQRRSRRVSLASTC